MDRNPSRQSCRDHWRRTRDRSRDRRRFRARGADVIGVDIYAAVDPRSGVTPSTRVGLEETGKPVRAAGRRWLGMEADTRDLPALREAALKAEQEFGGVDILFANAGIQSFHPLLEMEDAD